MTLLIHVVIGRCTRPSLSVLLLLFRIVNFLVENGNVIVKNCVEIDEISEKNRLSLCFCLYLIDSGKYSLSSCKYALLCASIGLRPLSLLLLRDLAVDGGRGRCRDKDSNVTLIDRARQIHRRTDGTDGRV